ncbi:MAG: hypothetical protein IT487_11225 [Chromatiaceae bacterium]|nr:hypothetical protein [Chromatiaceae bacterium]
MDCYDSHQRYLERQRLEVFIIQRLSGQAAAHDPADFTSSSPRPAPTIRATAWEPLASEQRRIRLELDNFQPSVPVARLLRYHLAQVHRLELSDMVYTLDDLIKSLPAAPRPAPN